MDVQILRNSSSEKYRRSYSYVINNGRYPQLIMEKKFGLCV